MSIRQALRRKRHTYNSSMLPVDLALPEHARFKGDEESRRRMRPDVLPTDDPGAVR